MQRWWRIFVLMLVAIPLVMPVAQLSPSTRCVTRKAADHSCCQQHTEIDAPSCCDAGTNSYLAEGRTTADAAQISVASHLISLMPVQARSEGKLNIERRTSYISILVPALILRT
ncbi:MAG TPA: hypothetical protein VL346_10700 [Acidobacteriaceae bacterium]|nr:hypothetical protein [Acidobacteriaceae bacterium]